MPDDTFEQLINSALDALPAEFSEKLENVSVVIADWPTPEQLNKVQGSRGNLLLGLYEGVPQTRRGHYGVGATLPDKITIFKLPILMVARTHAAVVAQIKDTVLHEIAHHFGMTEKDIENAKVGSRPN